MLLLLLLLCCAVLLLVFWQFPVTKRNLLLQKEMFLSQERFFFSRSHMAQQKALVTGSSALKKYHMPEEILCKGWTFIDMKKYFIEDEIFFTGKNLLHGKILMLINDCLYRDNKTNIWIVPWVSEKLSVVVGKFFALLSWHISLDFVSPIVIIVIHATIKWCHCAVWRNKHKICAWMRQFNEGKQL